MLTIDTAILEERSIWVQPIKSKGGHIEIQIAPKVNNISREPLENIYTTYGDWRFHHSGEEINFVSIKSNIEIQMALKSNDTSAGPLRKYWYQIRWLNMQPCFRRFEWVVYRSKSQQHTDIKWQQLLTLTLGELTKTDVSTKSYQLGKDIHNCNTHTAGSL